MGLRTCFLKQDSPAVREHSLSGRSGRKIPAPETSPCLHPLGKCYWHATLIHGGQSSADRRKILLREVHLSAPHVPARAQIRYDPLEKASKCSRALQMKLSVGIHAVLHAQVRGLKKMQLIQNKDSTPMFSPQTTFNVSKGCCPSVSGRINTML